MFWGDRWVYRPVSLRVAFRPPASSGDHPYDQPRHLRKPAHPARPGHPAVSVMESLCETVHCATSTPPEFNRKMSSRRRSTGT